MIKRGDIVELGKFFKLITFFFKGLKHFRNSQFVVELVDNDMCTVKYNGQTYKAPVWALKKRY